MNLSNWLLKIAAVYFMGGSVFGLAMAITHDFSEAPVHAHLNLLGWVSLAVIGLIYRAQPGMAQTRLALAHFWLHNAGLPIGMSGLFLLLRGESHAMPVVSVGMVCVVLGIACFVANVMLTLTRGRQLEREYLSERKIQSAGL